MDYYKNCDKYTSTNYLYAAPKWGAGDPKAPGGKNSLRRLCLISVIAAFVLGLLVGILIPVFCLQSAEPSSNLSRSNGGDSTPAAPIAAEIRTIFFNNSYSNVRNSSTEFATVSFVENDAKESPDSLILTDDIFWGQKVENALPEGFDSKKYEAWSKIVDGSVAVKLETGCGRMQNRLVTFQNGQKACVRYRQNTDQIQGELFSFYLAQILKLPNLVPSVVTTVDLKAPLWKNLGHEIASAQWNSNRPVVLTQYVPDLEQAGIPDVFKPSERHLNKNDVANMTQGDLKPLVELAQWSDLIIFDYLTANLDRIVNNLYNYQWNVNIMDAPAHNLARRPDSSLLVFLDNESGLLHGYRLLKKYEIYHSLLLDNLCLFRRQTADAIRGLKRKRNVGDLLQAMFERLNGHAVKDVLPALPDKSVKILNERIDRVYNQIVKCDSMFSSTRRRNSQR